MKLIPKQVMLLLYGYRYFREYRKGQLKLTPIYGWNIFRRRKMTKVVWPQRRREEAQDEGVELDTLGLVSRSTPGR